MCLKNNGIWVKPYEQAHHHEAQMHTWLTATWGQVDAPVPAEQGHYPTPLFATDEQDQLLGTLTYTRTRHPDTPEPVIWVNTVYVDTAHRGKGVAQALIQQAMTDNSTLWVLTEFPKLYSQLGWRIHCEADSETILQWGRLSA